MQDRQSDGNYHYVTDKCEWLKRASRKIYKIDKPFSLQELVTLGS